jgi:hypothetical protein
MTETTRYELPPEGISLLGYIVRRMHKTSWLVPVSRLLFDGENAKALEHIAIYTAASSTSYGRAYYQPSFNATGASLSETDPATGATVKAHLESTSPHYVISYEVILPNGGTLEGSETITGTTVGLRGLRMPAPSRFKFTSRDYTAKLTGIITSELALSLLGNTRIRAYGSLNFEDSLGNSGRLELKRDGELTISINDQVTYHSLVELPEPETA